MIQKENMCVAQEDQTIRYSRMKCISAVSSLYKCKHSWGTGGYIISILRLVTTNLVYTFEDETERKMCTAQED